MCTFWQWAFFSGIWHNLRLFYFSPFALPRKCLTCFNAKTILVPDLKVSPAAFWKISLWPASLASRCIQQQQQQQITQIPEEVAGFLYLPVWWVRCPFLKQTKSKVRGSVYILKCVENSHDVTAQVDAFFWDNILCVIPHCYTLLDVYSCLHDIRGNILSCPLSLWLPCRPAEAGGRLS